MKEERKKGRDVKKSGIYSGIVGILAGIGMLIYFMAPPFDSGRSLPVPEPHLSRERSKELEKELVSEAAKMQKVDGLRDRDEEVNFSGSSENTESRGYFAS